MKPNLESAAQMIAYYRAKARECDRIADEMQKEFNIANPIAPASIAHVPAKHSTEAVDPESIAKILARKPYARPVEIAKSIGADKEAVMNALQANPERFIHTGRGWYQLKKTK